MRRSPTPAEGILWQSLRRDALGWHFRRQHPIGPFVADFCCPKARLVLEVDGAVHVGAGELDAARTEQLAEMGYRVLRFENDLLVRRLSFVLATIAAELHVTPRLGRPSPSGSRMGRGGA